MFLFSLVIYKLLEVYDTEFGFLTAFNILSIKKTHLLPNLIFSYSVTIYKS